MSSTYYYLALTCQISVPENMKNNFVSTETDGQDINSSPFPCFPQDHNLQGLPASPVGTQVPQVHSSLPRLRRVCGFPDIQCLHLGFSLCSCLNPSNCWPLRWKLQTHNSWNSTRNLLLCCLEDHSRRWISFCSSAMQVYFIRRFLPSLDELLLQPNLKAFCVQCIKWPLLSGRVVPTELSPVDKGSLMFQNGLNASLLWPPRTLFKLFSS